MGCAQAGLKYALTVGLTLRSFFLINPVSGKAVRRTNSPSDALPQVELSLRTRALNLRLDYEPGSHSGANLAIRLGLTNSVSMVLTPFIGDKVMFFLGQRNLEGTECLGDRKTWYLSCNRTLRVEVIVAASGSVRAQWAVIAYITGQRVRVLANRR